MKIVQLVPELNEGGVERGTVELNREFCKRGHQSIVISSGGKLSEQVIADGGQHIVLDVCSKNPFSAFSRVAKLRKLLRQLAPDIVHARSRVPAWLILLANRQLHIPFVTTVHGYNSVNLYSKVMSKGDRVICVSDGIKAYIQRNYKVPDEKITVIHRGIDPGEFDPDSLDLEWIDSFKKKYCLAGKHVVTSVGRITELKDYETFIRAVKRASHAIPHIRGLIVGGVRHDKQDYFERLQQLIKEIAAEDLIIFAGSQKQMPEIYALSDTLVSCSKKPESFGRTMVEAMAMNTPVIATRHGGALDIVKEGETGYLVKPENVDQLTQAICRISEIEVGGLRKYVLDNFLLEQMVTQTLAVYAQLDRTSLYEPTV